MKPITVLLADDHMIVREGFRKLLESEPDLLVVAEAQTGRQAVELAAKHRPEVVVMDISMPLLNGLEATRQIRKALPSTKVVILSAHGDGPYVEKAIELGVSGFLFKQSSATTLANAIRAVHRGAVAFSPAITKRLSAGKLPGKNAPAPKRAPALTSRELEVLQLIAESKANKEVASELGIGIKTVEKHREHLMQKLDIHDAAGLTRYALTIGIIECDLQSSAE